MSTPTEQAYTELQHVYDVFNTRLFAGQLPPCLITMQRAHSPLFLFWRLWPVLLWVWPCAQRIPGTYVVVAHRRMAGGGTVVPLAALLL